MKIAPLVLVAGVLLILPGCATLAIGVAAGFAGGVAHFGGKKVAEYEYDRYQRERRCNKLRTSLHRQRCLNRMRYIQSAS